MPQVSIIIPAFNAARFLPEAVESALRQTARAHEILVVNDGSTDNTDEIIGPFLNRVTYLKQPNQGVSAARNAGAAHASGEWALFLDADDRLHPRALETLLGSARGESHSQVLHGDVIDIDECGQCIGQREVPDLQGPPPSAARHLFQFGSIPPSAFVVPLWLFRQVGGFDPRLSYAADLHLWMRCACLAPVTHVSNLVLYYRVHGSNMSRHSLTAFRDLIDAKMDFQRWCRERGFQVFGKEVSLEEIVSGYVRHYYYQRNWLAVDVTLQLADEMGVANAAVRRIAQLRRLPKWLFTVKDKLDVVRRRLAVSPSNPSHSVGFVSAASNHEH